MIAAVAVAGGHLAAAHPFTLSSTGQKSIPFSQLGDEAQKHFKGAGIDIKPTQKGAKLQAIMQDLEAEATPEGLWLTSTAEEDSGMSNLFCVRAMALGRKWIASPAVSNMREPGEDGVRMTVLPPAGIVRTDSRSAIWLRPGLAEEYTVSTDGVRQDFIILERPSGEADGLVVELDVAGARLEGAAYGARLTLTATGRELAYSRLKVTDSAGKELTARMEVRDHNRLDIVVDDAEAVYPVRIDPTFSDADWISMGGIPGANSEVYALVVDGSGNLYASGSFTLIGDVQANRVAKWNGSAWSALGSGISGTNFFVHALAVIGGDVYAGGAFTTAGGISANRIAKWNGTAWTALGTGLDDWVNSLAANGGDLYVGGDFLTAGGVTANRIAKWSGGAWSALGSGMNSSVYALAVGGGQVYAGGVFGTAGGVSAIRIAKWDGSAWSALGSGMNNASNGVYALAVSGNDLYAGGTFTTAGGVSAVRIAKWNGSAWSALGSGMPNIVRTLAMIGSDLYAGGNFLTAGGVSAVRIAKWNGSAWSALGTGMNSSVYALAVSGGDLYAGGNFIMTGAVEARCIARWTGSTWSALGSGVGTSSFDTVHAIAVKGTDVYAAGSFTLAGGVPVTNVAKWNGTSWSALGSGVAGTAYALAMIGGDLYVGGNISNFITKWNGSAWSTLGSGTNGIVLALAASGSDLYAGGSFTAAGGVANTSRIAKWNGSAWSALGTGMNEAVRALTVNGSTVYAGGSFTTAGGVAAPMIAKWNGSAWSALGNGLNSMVSALTVNGTDLYAGGSFTAVNMGGGQFVNYIAKWDGSAWSALGSGMNSAVLALNTSGGVLYAGGGFTTAGGKVSGYVARANVGTSLTALESWRQQWFGTTANSGDAADLFDFDKDGLVNLIEWACNLDPTTSDRADITVQPNGADLEFFYDRSVAAVNAGAVFTVEWSDTLSSPGWSSAGVSQQTLSDNGTLQEVKATVSTGSMGRRFLRLRIAPPPL